MGDRTPGAADGSGAVIVLAPLGYCAVLTCLTLPCCDGSVVIWQSVNRGAGNL